MWSLQNIEVVPSINDIFHAYLSLLSLCVGLAPEATILCLEIIFDNMVDDIWWFAMLLRPIFAKIDKEGQHLFHVICYIDNPHRKTQCLAGAPICWEKVALTVFLCLGNI